MKIPGKATLEGGFATLRSHIQPNSGAAIAVALGAVALATGLRWMLLSTLPLGTLPFSFYFPVVLFATLLGGARAGAASLAASAVAAWWFFALPVNANPVPVSRTGLLTFFLSLGVLTIWGAERYRRLVVRLEEEEHHRDLVVAELRHRVNNKLATVYAIVRRELKQSPEVWNKIERRLRSLAATDQFISRSNDDAIPLRGILEMETAPYTGSRIDIHVPDVELPANIATMLALIFHELATNAAKYGALSQESGTIRITGSKTGNTVKLNWTEHSGPKVQTPERRGMGTRLIECALEPYRGTGSVQFEPDGLQCSLQFDLPGETSSEAGSGESTSTAPSSQRFNPPDRSQGKPGMFAASRAG